jgi:hypothetical protein
MNEEKPFAWRSSTCGFLWVDRRKQQVFGRVVSNFDEYRAECGGEYVGAFVCPDAAKAAVEKAAGNAFL